MNQICFATNNKNKLKEVQEMLSGLYKVISLEEIGCGEELPENQETLEGNSLEKAQYVFDNFGIPVFADDTGLEVEALDGRPGVYSARYGGPQRDSLDNMNKLLLELTGVEDRAARFRTVITLIDNDQTKQFQGIVNGSITKEIIGQGGFGYDPIFIPEGHSITFGEMTSQDKNQISHRKRAIQALVNFLTGD